jgi:membrane fusion protein, multidrug efflux system
MVERVESKGGGAAVAGARTVVSPGHSVRHGPHSDEPASVRIEPPPRQSWRRWVALAILAGAATFLIVAKGVPWYHHYFSHVSTDDAFVVGDATSVASRIADVVAEVLVHDYDFVERGMLLVRLDQEPYRLLVEQKRSDVVNAKLSIDRSVRSVESARADLQQARDQVRSSLAALEEAWRAVQAQQEQVRYRLASLRAEAASVRAAQADLILAQKDYERVKRLVDDQTATREELDQKLAAYQSARERYKAGEQKVQQARAMLALAPDYQHPEQIPDDLERTGTEVRRAVAAGEQILARLGLTSGLHGLEPESLQRALHDLTGQTSENWVDDVPSVRAAQAVLDQAIAMLGGPSYIPAKPYEHPSVSRAQKELDEAELRLSYTEIRAPISGFVNRRAVNPGDTVQAGQGLLSIQPLDQVYIVANFKETQLADLQIGRPVEIAVDAYPSRVFRGRVSGFAPATGAASSILPPENATGNFVKVVQRVPVRIDLTEPNPREAPLLVGMSVVPEVDVKTEPAGPDAGRRLRGLAQRSTVQEVRR